MFQLDDEPLGRTDLISYDIKTNSHPIRQPPRRFPLGQREEGEKQIPEMLEKESDRAILESVGDSGDVSEEEGWILSVLY